MTLDLVLRIFVGGLLGGLIGLERELREKEAGFRTHFLVAVGSALLTVISAYGYDYILPLFSSEILSFDPSRIAAQIVSGIGFIGAGLIFIHKNAVRGLTTAAGIWTTSAIGVAAGVGHYDFAIATTFLVLLALEGMLFVNKLTDKKHYRVSLSALERDRIRDVVDIIRQDNVNPTSFRFETVHDKDKAIYRATFEIQTRRKDYDLRLLDLMIKVDGSVEKIN